MDRKIGAAAIMALAVGVLAISGCGGSDENSSSGSATSATSTSTTTATTPGATTTTTTTAGGSTAGAASTAGTTASTAGTAASTATTTAGAAGETAGAATSATAAKQPPIVFGQDAGLKISATVAPYPPDWRQPETLTLDIKDKSGKPVTGAKIQGSLNMTNMNMGETKPTFQDVGNGAYTTTPKFAMGGPWRLKLTVDAPGHKPVTHNLDYTVS